jgi:hypothetical protein
MTTREQLQRNPGYSLFRQGLAALNISLQEKYPNPNEGRRTFMNDFIIHDVRTGIGSLAFFRMVVDDMHTSTPELRTSSPVVWKEIENYNQLERKGYVSVRSNTSAREVVQLCDTWVESAKRLMAHIPPSTDIPEIYAQKAQALVRSWGMFHHSAQFLIGITANNERQAMRSLKKLQSEQIATSDIIYLALNEGNYTFSYSGEMPESVNGVEATILYNLLKNAGKQSNEYIKLDHTGGTWRVRNDAKKYPNTSTLFQPGKPGEGGNTGFGLFTMKHMIGALGGYDVHLSNEHEEHNGPPFNVEFTIQARRQAPSW